MTLSLDDSKNWLRRKRTGSLEDPCGLFILLDWGCFWSVRHSVGIPTRNFWREMIDTVLRTAKNSSRKQKVNTIHHTQLSNHACNYKSFTTCLISYDNDRLPCECSYHTRRTIPWSPANVPFLFLGVYTTPIPLHPITRQTNHFYKLSRLSSDFHRWLFNSGLSLHVNRVIFDKIMALSEFHCLGLSSCVSSSRPRMKLTGKLSTHNHQHVP